MSSSSNWREGRLPASSDDRISAFRCIAIRDRFDRFGVTTPEGSGSSSSTDEGPNEVRNEAAFRDLVDGRFRIGSVYQSQLAQLTIAKVSEESSKANDLDVAYLMNPPLHLVQVVGHRPPVRFCAAHVELRRLSSCRNA